MDVIRIWFPKTEAGRIYLREFISLVGIREIYPDERRLGDYDWDSIAELLDEYERDQAISGGRK